MSFFTQFTGGTITGYTQSSTLTVSGSLAVPLNTQRIEALVVGGGGDGSTFESGGGFGGAAVIEIPVTGESLVITIGAGGSPGSSSTVASAGTIYARVGGGGVGGTATGGAGNFGGGGGGGASAPSASSGGAGGGPPIGNLLWSIYPSAEGATGVAGAGGVVAANVGNAGGAGSLGAWIQAIPDTPTCRPTLRLQAKRSARCDGRWCRSSKRRRSPVSRNRSVRMSMSRRYVSQYFWTSKVDF